MRWLVVLADGREARFEEHKQWTEDERIEGGHTVRVHQVLSHTLELDDDGTLL